MSAICLSQAPILRCQSLTRIESGVLLIPPAIEVIFCLAVVVANSGFDRKHILLITEGCVYFFLALLDLLVHVIPSIGQSTGVFKPLDVFTGAASCVPLLLYTLFLCMFQASELIPTLPPRFRLFTRYLLHLFIPLTIAFNELGSFFSLSYRVIGINELVVGFTDHTVHVLFDSLALSLLVGYQVLNFGIAYYRLFKAFERQKRSAATAGEREITTHSFRGLGWIVAGLVLGTAETLVGFAPNGFATAMARRALRMLGRVCLLIGVVNGVDKVEDFRIANTQNRRMSMLRGLISNPRNSVIRSLTVHDFDPEAVFTKQQKDSFDAPSKFESHRTSSRLTFLVPQALAAHRASSPAPLSAAFTIASFIAAPSRPASALLAVRETRPHASPQQRVTVHWGGGGAPMLELKRFSDLKLDLRALLPPPDLLRARSLPLLTLGDLAAASEDGGPRTATSTLTSSTEAGVISTAVRAHALPARHTITGEAVAAHLARSNSGASESMEIVRALAMQFPGIPATIPAAHPVPPPDSPQPEPGPAPAALSRESSQTSKSGLVRRSSSVKRKPVPVELQAEAASIVRTLSGSAPHTPLSRSHSARTVTSVDSKGQEVELAAQPELSLPTPQSMNAVPFAGPQRKSLPPGNRTAEKHKRARTMSASRHPAAVSIDSTASMEEPNVRIKSIGSAPRRWTPNPISTSASRGSIAVEWDVLMDKASQDDADSQRGRHQHPRKLQKRRSRSSHASHARPQDQAKVSMDGSFFVD